MSNYFAPLGVHFDEHPKYAELDLAHLGLIACAITYANRNLTDGVIPRKAVRGFGADGGGEAAASRLVELGIWEATETGFLIVGYLDHNQSKAQVEARHKAKSTAGKKGGKESGRKRSSCLPSASSKREAPACGLLEPNRDTDRDREQDPPSVGESARGAGAQAPVSDAGTQSALQVGNANAVSLDALPPTTRLQSESVPGSHPASKSPVNGPEHPAGDLTIADWSQGIVDSVAMATGRKVDDIRAVWAQFVAHLGAEGRPITRAEWSRWVTRQVNRPKPPAAAGGRTKTVQPVPDAKWAKEF